MAASLDVVAAQSLPMTGPQTRWERIFLFLVGSLASTVMIKIGPVQILELVYLAQIAVLIREASRTDGNLRVFRPLARIGMYFVWFSIASFILALVALRLDFYTPESITPLKGPILITISRIVELMANVTIMIYLANQFRRFPGKARFTMRVYFWTGVASGVYSILTYPLDVAGIASLGAYLDSHRLRGFYNEGGPWGIYLLTVLFVGYVLTRLHWESRNRIWIGYAIVVAVLPGSASKAAAVAIPVFLLLIGIFARSFIAKVAIITSIVFLTIALMRVADPAALFRTYIKSGDVYERESARHRGDGNYIYGRVAGLFIIPRMVAAHPLTGIGWGNYGLVRNAPEFRGASVWADIDDDPGLGIAGLTADLGLPLFAFLLLCLAVPFATVRRLNVPAYIINMALLQPAAHICGAQLNLTYPWVVTSFALGLAFWSVKQTPHAPIQYLRNI